MQVIFGYILVNLKAWIKSVTGQRTGYQYIMDFANSLTLCISTTTRYYWLKLGLKGIQGEFFLSVDDLKLRDSS